MWKVTTAPAFEPISLVDAKNYLRVQNSSEDSAISDIIEAARDYCEQELDLALIDQSITLKLDAFPDGRTIYLPRTNLLEVTSFAYLDQNSVSQTFTDYTADTFSTPARLVNNTETWPETADAANAITIVYRAGFAESDTRNIPPAVNQAMRLLITHYYNNREAVVIGSPSEEVALGVTYLLSKHRRYGV